MKNKKNTRQETTEIRGDVNPSSLLYRMAYHMGMHQKKKLSRVAFLKRSFLLCCFFFFLGTVLFVWLPRAAYIGTAELAVILLVGFIVFFRVILSLILGFLGFEKAKEGIKKRTSKTKISN